MRFHSVSEPGPAQDEPPTRPGAPAERLIERFAPEAMAHGRHEVRIRAPADLVFEVAEGFDLLSIPAVHAIFRLRAGLLRAPLPRRDDLKGLIHETQRMGWAELARRPGRELVMGAAVQPWLAEPVFKPVAPDRFLDYAAPEHVKIVWTLEAEPLGPALTRFTTETRVQPTDDAARRRFRRYWRFAGIGIVLVRLLALPAVRREAERRVERAAVPEPGRSNGPPLLERFLPAYDATIVRQTVVQATPEVTYAAITETNLMDPVVRGLFSLREGPARVLARFRGASRPPLPRSLAMKDLLRPETGMVVLAEEPEVETLVGSVGRFWERDYGWRRVSAEEFPGFDEPGYAKLAVDLWVQPAGDGGSLLRYEARTATTDEAARRRFRCYWRLIRPGVGLVMGRAVSLIRKEAERRFEARAPGSEPEASTP
jgi:hypothetical protein